VLSVMSALRGESWHLPVVLSAWLAWGISLVLGSLIAFNAYMLLLARTSASLAASYSLVNPVVALCLGVTLGARSRVDVGMARLGCGYGWHRVALKRSAHKQGASSASIGGIRHVRPGSRRPGPEGPAQRSSTTSGTLANRILCEAHSMRTDDTLCAHFHEVEDKPH